MSVAAAYLGFRPTCGECLELGAPGALECARCGRALVPGPFAEAVRLEQWRRAAERRRRSEEAAVRRRRHVRSAAAAVAEVLRCRWCGRPRCTVHDDLTSDGASSDGASAPDRTTE